MGRLFRTAPPGPLLCSDQKIEVLLLQNRVLELECCCFVKDRKPNLIANPRNLGVTRRKDHVQVGPAGAAPIYKAQIARAGKPVRNLVKLAPFDRLPDVSEIAPPQKAPFYRFLPTTIRARALAIRGLRRMVTMWWRRTD